MLSEICPPAPVIRLLEDQLHTPVSTRVGVGAAGYANHLATSSYGYPSLHSWCVWIEPDTTGERGGDYWSWRWISAVRSAFEIWSRTVPVTQVVDPERANIHVLRKRPSLREIEQRWRASNGRSLLRIVVVARGGRSYLEPRVQVLISPNLQARVIQNTALHELGHAFGLWGHSKVEEDIMYFRQGSNSLLRLSHRDQHALEWVRTRCVSQFGRPLL